MSCVIFDLQVSAAGSPGGTAAGVTIAGRAKECARVRIEFSCAGPAPFFAEADVDPATGGWSVVAANLPCVCGGPFKLFVRCAQDPTCQAELAGDLNCQAAGACPSVTDVHAVAGDCDLEGARSVTLVATIVNGTGSVAVGQWEFEPGAFGPAIVVPAGAALVVSQTHAYPAPGSHTAVLSISVPSGCPSSSLAVNVEACPPPCLTAGDVAVAIAPNCNANGTRTATFTFPVVVAGRLRFGDGSNLLFTASSVSHDYATPPSFYQAVLEVKGCDRVEIPVGPLNPCPVVCPQPGSVGVSAALNCAANGTRDVTLTLPFAASVQIDFGDGASVGFNGSSVTHGYTPPGPYTATVTAQGCPPISVPVGPLEECGGPPRGACCLPDGSCVETTGDECRNRGGAYQGDGKPCAEAKCGGGGGGGGGGGSGCGAFTPLIAFLLAVTIGLTLVVITLQFCLGVSVPGLLIGILIGLGIAVALAVVGWIIICNLIPDCPCPGKCDGLLIAWIPLLAGAIVALYLSGCCGLMLAIGIGLFVAWGAAFAVWRAACDPGKCLTLDYLSLAVVTGAGTALSILGLLQSNILPCGLQPVATAAAILGGLLVAAAAACHAAE